LFFLNIDGDLGDVSYYKERVGVMLSEGKLCCCLNEGNDFGLRRRDSKKVGRRQTILEKMNEG